MLSLIFHAQPLWLVDAFVQSVKVQEKLSLIWKNKKGIGFSTACYSHCLCTISNSKEKEIMWMNCTKKGLWTVFRWYKSFVFQESTGRITPTSSFHAHLYSILAFTAASASERADPIPKCLARPGQMKNTESVWAKLPPSLVIVPLGGYTYRRWMPRPVSAANFCSH